MKKNIDHPFYLHIEFDIELVDRKADNYRNSFYMMRIGLIFIAGLMTVISGLNGFETTDNKNCLLNAILILGALITAMTSLDTLFQIETKKNIYKLMLVELREIRSEIVYYSDCDPGNLDEKIRTHLFPKYQSIMAYSKTLIEKKDNDKSDDQRTNTQNHNTI